MCFSAGASFVAAGTLAATGVISVRAAPSRRHGPLAAVPLVFAAQQACEGVLWMIVERSPFGKSETAFGRVFLLFALAIWPAYVPLALLALEKGALRRRTLAVLAAFGAALGGYLMACASLRTSDVCIAFGNLYYWVQIDTPLKDAATYAYIGTIAAALLVSSLRGTAILAALVIASAAIVGTLYRAGFVSVWCFFAALLSGAVVIVVRARAPHDLTPFRETVE